VCPLYFHTQNFTVLLGEQVTGEISHGSEHFKTSAHQISSGNRFAFCTFQQMLAFHIFSFS